MIHNLVIQNDGVEVMYEYWKENEAAFRGSFSKTITLQDIDSISYDLMPFFLWVDGFDTK